MSDLPAIAVALPLLTGAVLTGAQPLLPRRVIDAIGLLASCAVLVLCVTLTRQASEGEIVSWMGGWRPREGMAIGIALVVDPFGAGLAALAALLMTASLLFSWRYFKAPGGLYHALMLVFLGGMVGFCLSGDLFTRFVAFELASVAAYALAAFKIEEEKSLEGALHFAVISSLAALLVLIGIALVYGRTGALNLAEIGRTLATRPADGLVLAAFVLMLAGFCVKGALVPFHFWVADAHAVAPAPVCVVLSGVMVELGVYDIAHTYATAFSSPLGPHDRVLSGLLLGVGAVSAIVGALMCLLQRHLKRMLAFSTISQVGMLLMAVGLLTPQSLAGGAYLLVTHGLIKGALFLLAGILLHRGSSVDENRLCGFGRRLPWTGACFVLAGLGLAGLPPFGTAIGRGLVDEAARRAGQGWVGPWIVMTGALGAGAVLRAAGRVFFGWGPPFEENVEGPSGEVDDPETGTRSGRTPWFMLTPVVVLLVTAIGLGLAPGLDGKVIEHARRFLDRESYAAMVLDGRPPAPDSPRREAPLTSGWGPGLATTVLALVIAAPGLFGHRLPEAWRERPRRVVRPAMEFLRSLHSGLVGDYVAWLVLGVAIFGLVLMI